MGVTIRHYFNSKHSRAGNPTWTWLATAILFLIVAWLSTIPRADEVQQEAGLRQEALIYASADGFEEVTDIVMGRCSMCHAAEPGWEGMHWPPKDVVLETPEQIAGAARRIYLQAGVSHAMPPANLSYMEPQERAAIVRWFETAKQGGQGI
jgi:uncharacterized membrane protein